ncbi:hypothetical protein SAMN02745219_01723 [Desulfofundulus thermosubterraneus DSM 16057]|uniref:Uncharacterized protein n=1 Tax=Desulfofundulus thermosubterraneus DSM 16057 TaxID=1121432 RepID=A0A1M6GG17_9FIRM|nr:hypothetical protein SAMN02745219_01723 [Desulfofundulus thermosubterraneus DSM 16057]
MLFEPILFVKEFKNFCVAVPDVILSAAGALRRRRHTAPAGNRRVPRFGGVEVVNRILFFP